jgi:copper chaperone CopZ
MKAVLTATLLFQTALVFATEEKAQTVKATYSITGLHCPPCTRTVESSLAKVKGVKSAKVDWKTKSAKIEFDENQLTAQQVAHAVAKTAHMMGPSMHYESQLTLSVPGVLDEQTATQAKEALKKVMGVASVTAQPKQHTVSIQFSSDGKTSSKQLIDALDAAGLKASTY